MKKYGRLVVGGCSHSYGHGSPDCMTYGDERDHTQPQSKFAWPNVLANKLEIPHVNISGGGWSNKYIWYRLNNFLFKKNDLVIIQWTYDNRINFIGNKGENVRILPWTKNHSYYMKKFFSETDQRATNFLYIDHLATKLKGLGVDFYFVQAGAGAWLKAPKWFSLAEHNKIDRFCFDDIINTYPKGTDGAHTGAEGQAAFADMMYDEIERKQTNAN